MTKEEALASLAARDPMIIGDHSPDLKPGFVIRPSYWVDAYVGDEDIRLVVVRKATEAEYRAVVGPIADDFLKQTGTRYFYEVTTD